MSKQTEKTTLVNEIIDSASTLPIEYQDKLLSIAKAMAFTRNCMATEKTETNGHKTA